MSKINSTLFVIICILCLSFSLISLIDSKQNASAQENNTYIHQGVQLSRGK